MRISRAKLNNLLTAIRTVLPGAEFAPDESWTDDDEAYSFRNECGCYSQADSEPASLTVFLEAPLKDQHYNIVAIVTRVVRDWSKQNLMWVACPACRYELKIDIRLFDRPAPVLVSPQL